MNIINEATFYTKQGIRTYRGTAQIQALQSWIAQAFARTFSLDEVRRALLVLAADGVVRQNVDGSFAWLGEFAGK